MSSKYNRARGHGPVGEALDALAEEYGTLTALAKLLGCGIESLSRWIRGEAKPAPKYAEKLCDMTTDLRTLLVEHGCFVEPNRRPRAPGKMGPGTSRRTLQRRDAARKVPRLPWPSKATKKARRPLLALLIAARQEQSVEREEERRKSARQIARKAMPSHPHRLSHSGDFIERLDVLTDVLQGQ